MPATLRPYQLALVDTIRREWAAGHRNVLARLPTGGGKTVCVSHIVSSESGLVRVIAHRQELVGQLSMALARDGVAHALIAPDTVIRGITGMQVREYGRSYLHPRATVAVAGVDTLIRREDPAASRVGLWVIDEAHHVLRDNKWGTAVARYANARGLGPTATPCRADGRGLGRHASGVFDVMVHGPEGRELQAAGFLTGYRILAPKSDLDLSRVEIGATGDYVAGQAREAVHKSHITGDVVAHYIKHAAGKRGVTFCVDVEAATETAAAFNAAGVPAAVVSAKSPDPVRAAAIRQLREGRYLQLVNVDLFGEGFDLPAIEVVSFARPTASYALYAQQFGRALRPLEGKDRAIILDHVGNVIRHGLPDSPREWTLDDRERKSRSTDPDVLPLRACPECSAVYYRYLHECPECGHYPEPASRSAPEYVDGDLLELDEATLARLRGEVARIDSPPVFPYGAGPEVVGAIKKRHRERQEAQYDLRETIALWAGYLRDAGRTDSEGYRIFWHKFGIDVCSAQSLGAADARKLRGLIIEDLT